MKRSEFAAALARILASMQFQNLPDDLDIWTDSAVELATRQGVFVGNKRVPARANPVIDAVLELNRLSLKKSLLVSDVLSIYRKEELAWEYFEENSRPAPSSSMGKCLSAYPVQ